MCLSAMPKALGFTDQSKVYFLHKFSSGKHLKYVGPFPPPSDYGVERMTEGEQQQFYSIALSWEGSGLPLVVMRTH